MRMKPRSTVKNDRALLYKRFTAIEKSLNFHNVYKTIDEKFWSFNSEELSFEELDGSTIPEQSKITIISDRAKLQYKDEIFGYENSKWVHSSVLENDIVLSAKFGNIGKYQTNKYYFAGSFDYMLRGSEEGTTTQFIKGNILPLSSFNIKYFNDDVDLVEDDLVVADGRLFAIEDIQTVQKRQPKPFLVHFATLNSIL